MFYSVTDRLVFYSILCVEARKRNVKVLSLCLMLNHVHALVQTRDYASLRRFCTETEKQYTQAFNANSHLAGPLFQTTFGWAPKRGEKKIRTCLAYIANNPVEKGLCARAEENRWTFLRYGLKNNPFSDSFRLDYCSWRLRKAVTEVRSQRDRGKPLSYVLLSRIAFPLTTQEREQLTDRIISLYSVIDYDASKRYFKSFRAMLEAFTVNTGSEYDIREDYECGAEKTYYAMNRRLYHAGFNMEEKSFFQLDQEELNKWILDFRMNCGATPLQIRRFLHLKGGAEM